MEIKCPICSISIEVTEEHIGHKGRCPCCESKFIIPASPGGEFQILHRGEIPNKVPGRKVSLVMPAKGREVRRRMPARLSTRESGPPVGMIAAATACVAVLVGFIVLRDNGSGAAKVAPPATTSNGLPTAPGPPSSSRDGGPETLAPQLTEPLATRESNVVETRPRVDPSPATVPDVVTRPPLEESLPPLTEDQKKHALGFLKSADASKRNAAYAGFRKRGDRDKPIYLELLAAARDHHSGALGSRAWDLATGDRVLTNFKDAHDSWMATRDTAKTMVQTNWKDQEAGSYKQKHAEMDAVTDKTIKSYERVIRLAKQAGEFTPTGLQQYADALGEIRGEIAWCDDREPSPPLDLLEEIADAGGADDYVATLNLVDSTKRIAAEHEAADDYNAGCSWADDAYKSFASILNARRVALGLTPLRLDEKLSKACGDHSAEMAANGYFSHSGLTPETKDFGTRARRAGFSGFATGECIFMGSPSPSAAHNAWWYSDGHRLIMYADNPNTLGLGMSGKHWTLNTGKL